MSTPDVHSPTLAVPGARLAYETFGNGPLLVMIPGATGVAGGFRRVAKFLAAQHTVLLYDRRGFSRSVLIGDQDYAHRLETDADDVIRLIEEVGSGPATIVGTSSGALVALSAAAHNPAVVHTVVPFEPPALTLLPDGQQWIEFFDELYWVFRRDGAPEALSRFRERTFTESDRQAMANAPRNDADLAYWFEHELRQYPTTAVDLEFSSGLAARILPAIGRNSHGYPACEATIQLAFRLGRDILELPGGHIGHLTHTEHFATELAAALAAARAGEHR